MKKSMPNSIRKYIRREKARIRREVLNLDEQNKLINQLYNRFLGKPQIKDIEKSKIKKDLPESKQKKSKRPASPTAKPRSREGEVSKTRRANKKEKL